MKNRIKGLLKAVLVVSALFLSTTLSAQLRKTEVELPGGRMTYLQIFSLIEQCEDVLFGYSTQDVDPGQSVSLPKGRYTTSDLLDYIMEDGQLRYSEKGKHILISRRDQSKSAVAQDDNDGFIPVSYETYEPKLPKLALKTNLLYDITTTMNLGLEIGLAPRWTLDIPFSYNPWVFKDETRLRHWGVQPEARYWFCQRFDGWFIGLHLHYARFNVGGWPDWSFVSKSMQQNRYQGYLFGAGVSTGYSWILKNRWSMEATVGLGYARIVYDKFPCTECGTVKKKGTRDYFGPTKIGLSLVLMLK